MEITKRVVVGGKVVEELWGNGQCQCENCKQINWTNWCYHYDGKTICGNCLKRELEEDMQVAHASTETSKILYAERHLQILELQRQERKDLKNIIKAQNDEIQISDFYSKHFRGC